MFLKKDMIDKYILKRSEIENAHNGYAKIGCVAFSPSLRHQCVLCVWT